MSLDVHLLGPATEVCCQCAKCDHVHKRVSRETLFSANITHNLCPMAQVAGIYEAVWRPEEVGYTKAAQLIGPLTAGIARLEADPENFEVFNPPNGWGSYRNFVPWLKQYLAACEEYPEADIEASR